MNESICRFMPVKNEEASLKAVRFVYEAECRTLTQPFVHPIYVFHIVTEGTAILRIDEKAYPLKRGDVFFAFPAYPYYLEADEDFAYIYVSFMGSGAASLLSKCGISPAAAHYPDFGFLCTMFENAIRRLTPFNANLLTEAVLFYALSFFGGEAEAERDRSAMGLFESLVDYVDHHYREKDLSLGRLAEIFSYTEKYLSSLFKKNMQVGFVQYLNNLRIQYASEQIRCGRLTIAQIADACGYSDYAYFSRVFKKLTGRTPSESIRYWQGK